MTREERSSLSLWVLGGLLLVALSGCFEKGSQGSEPTVQPRDFASSERFTKLLVEVDYVEGRKPRDAAVNLLMQRIDERLSKPGGATVDQSSISASQSTYGVNDLRDLESRNRDRYSSGDTLVLYVLYVNGGSDQDTNNGKVLGVQYDRTSLAMFKDNIDNSGGTFGRLFGASDVERSVLVHEFGHAIGLVNHGVPMVRNHEDPDHEGHSTNEDSVMYWAVDNTLGLGEFFNSIPNNFDSDDIADLRAVGGK